jgi:hypothetical protein
LCQEKRHLGFAVFQSLSLGHHVVLCAFRGHFGGKYVLKGMC